MASVEEVIVTATKREQTLQDVPIAVSVVDEATIERAAIGYAHVRKQHPEIGLVHAELRLHRLGRQPRLAQRLIMLARASARAAASHLVYRAQPGYAFLQRLRQGNAASFESSSLHIDTMRDLKEINSLFVSIAYPLLEGEGLLRRSRLVQPAEL